MPAEALDSVYVHFVACHIGDQVARFGPLWYWSGEGLEHKNFVWKKSGRACGRGVRRARAPRSCTTEGPACDAGIHREPDG